MGTTPMRQSRVRATRHTSDFSCGELDIVLVDAFVVGAVGRGNIPVKVVREVVINGDCSILW